MLKQQAISYLNDVTSSLEYTLTVLRSLEAQARAELVRLGRNPKLEVLFDKLKV
ncbi:hypothetical protein JVU11DRAFT_2096 [Chiua virens]|nr:hypothetical protein JVU11DRAFT_2096 [Chiua virens]